jgi:RNA polymerase-binding transcription factor DksA
MTLDSTLLARLKEKLLAEKSRLEGELGKIARPTGVVGEYETQFENIGTDMDENATEVEDYADKLAVEGTLETELRDVNAALAKMNAGTYGVCEKTGQDIPVDRLEAYPAARTLVDV